MREQLQQYRETGLELMEENGLEFYFTVQFISGMGLLVFLPDGIVTPTFVSVYADHVLEVLLIAVVSASALVMGNFILYLFFRLLGERMISEQRKETRYWRLMNWAVNKNAPISLTIFRLSPVGSGLIAIPAGLLSVKIRTFLLYSFIGFLTFETASGLLTWYGLREDMAAQLVERIDLPSPRNLIE